MRLRLSTALLVLLPALTAAQTRPVTTVGTDSAVIAFSARYRAGGLHRFLLGDTYRDLWGTPIRVPVLDLRKFAGGLTPLKLSGGNQTTSLRFTAADGSEYVFRMVDKDRVTVPDGFKGTIVETLQRDQVSANHPAAAVVTAALLDATRVLHVHPVFAIMPDDTLLGKFREDFKGRIGMIEAYPTKPDEGRGFEGANQVLDSEELLKKIDSFPGLRIDARGFLQARLMDMFLNDWDRHPGQWKWARFDTSSVSTWAPIPRDRDKSFISHGGITRAAALVSPIVLTFKPTTPSVRAMTWNGLDYDRRILGGLEKPVWDSIAADLKRRLSDRVIDAAVRAMPKEIQDTAPALAAVLKARRDEIPDVANRYYAYLAPYQDIHATDAADQATITRRDDGSVEVAIRSGAGEPYFRRRFRPEETTEIRLYLHGGDDNAIVTGSAERSIPVRVIGGNGTNRLLDSSSVGGKPAPTRLYDVGTVSGVGYGPDSAWNRRPWIQRGGEQVKPPRDHGGRFAPGFGVTSERDLGLIFRLGASKDVYAFRATPYGLRWALSGEYATEYHGWRVGALVDRRMESSPLHFSVGARMSEIEVINFHGLGNDSPDDPDRFYEVRQRQWRVHPSLGLVLGGRGDLSLGPVIQYTSSEESPGRFVSETRPDGFGGFGQAGLRFTLTHDGRERSRDSRQGFLLNLSGSWYPAIWDVQEQFGVLAGAASTYFTIPVPAEPRLVLRAGARKVFGDVFPFQEAAFIGGRAAVRNLDPQRYAGDAALNGSAELQVSLARFAFILPLNVGVYGFADAGRVYVDGASPGGWHTAKGVGLWLGILSSATSIRVELGALRHVRTLRVLTGAVF